MKMNKTTVTMNAKKITTPSWVEEIRKFSKIFYHDDDDDNRQVQVKSRRWVSREERVGR